LEKWKRRSRSESELTAPVTPRIDARIDLKIMDDASTTLPGGRAGWPSAFRHIAKRNIKTIEKTLAFSSTGKDPHRFILRVAGPDPNQSELGLLGENLTDTIEELLRMGRPNYGLIHKTERGEQPI
jgi:hypothetical protein